jgi:hypothetical protein
MTWPHRPRSRRVQPDLGSVRPRAVHRRHFFIQTAWTTATARLVRVHTAASVPTSPHRDARRLRRVARSDPRLPARRPGDGVRQAHHERHEPAAPLVLIPPLQRETDEGHHRPESVHRPRPLLRARPGRVRLRQRGYGILQHEEVSPKLEAQAAPPSGLPGGRHRDRPVNSRAWPCAAAPTP